MDAYLFFMPVSSTDGSVSPTGKLRFKAIYKPNFTPGPTDTSQITVTRPSATILDPIIDTSVVIKPDPIPI
jgi:hypothetical protein